MPFVAKLRSTGERIDITREPDPRHAFAPTDIVCQLCAEAMIIKAGNVVRHHFAHRARCTSDYGAHPESPEHLMGKEYIARFVHYAMEEYSGARIEYEVPLREVKRVADVMALFPNGWRVAFECQLASITPGELERRTVDYARAGVDVWWFLGKNANTRANQDWCLVNQGCVYEIEFEPGPRRRVFGDHVGAPGPKVLDRGA